MPAVAALQAARFDAAETKAREIVAEEPDNSVARAVAALTLYERTIQQLVADVQMFGAGLLTGNFNHRFWRFSLDEAEKSFAIVDEHLAVIEGDTAFRMPLCLACWEWDWSRDGEVDYEDRELFQVEFDANGDWLPKDDPRRKPTFMFDLGDASWARAMVAFQRAALNLVLAYDWTEISRLLLVEKRGDFDGVVAHFRLDEVERVHRARDLLLAGIGHADLARREYLRETDDDGEWVPNPAQMSHPLPLPVDEPLYETWEGMLRDLTQVVAGNEGISVTEVAQLGRRPWKEDPPRGYINIGKLLDEPGDIVIVGFYLEGLADAFDGGEAAEVAEQILKDTFGEKYVMQMKPTPLLSRVRRMKAELERGEESFERKLRYLLWLN
jgi:hypothetical protein